jgi:hypothetical protein
MNYLKLRVFKYVGVAGFVVGTLPIESSHAQHQDVALVVVDGKIETVYSGPAPVWTDVLFAPGFPPAPGDPPVQQDDPGFNAPIGSFDPGSFVGLEVVQPLWFWDGEMLATPPQGTVFELQNPLSEVLLVDATTPFEPIGFDFARAGDEGGIHQHIEYSLPVPVSPNGAYGLVMQVTAASLESSEPFLVVFNQRLPAEQFDLGVEAILEASGILAPPLVAGDYNGNGTVEQADLDLVLLHWGMDGSSPPEAWIGPQPDGTIDQAELDGVLLHWGNALESSSVAAGVPEPNALALLALAAAATSTALIGRRICVNLKRRG